MPEIIVKEKCPNCNREVVVYAERQGEGRKKDGIMNFQACNRCGKSFKKLTWRKRPWFIARELKPRER